MRPGKADLPPRLQWETEIWTWFWRLAEVPAAGGGPRAGRAAWLELIRTQGWCPDLAFGLLRVIEAALQPRDGQADDRR